MRAAALAGCAAVLAAGPALAQPLTREDFQKALEARDRTIAEMQQRISALEHALSTTAPPPTPIPGASATATTAAGPAKAAAAENDEAELQALSRTLVQRGALVLPPWRAEFIPSFGYSLTEVQGLALTPSPEGIPIVNDQRLRDDQARATAAFRLGLPFSNQIEVDVPYAYLRQSRAVGDGSHAVNEASGLSDVQLQFSHQFLRESGWRPDLTGGVSWRFPTGADPFRAPVSAIATGAGPPELSARFTAVKSSDPLVFFGTFTYDHPFAVNESVGRIQQGDAYGLELGTVLAVNPATSLTFGISQAFRGRSLIDGVGAPGTDSVISSLNLGFDRVLTPKLLFDLTLGVGLTRDTPDYSIQVSFPYRFR